jgi:hypothetical protein
MQAMLLVMWAMQQQLPAPMQLWRQWLTIMQQVSVFDGAVSPATFHF